MTRIEVDRQACIGAGLCAWNAPEVFEQDDQGLSRVRAGAGSGQGPNEGAAPPAAPAWPPRGFPPRCRDRPSRTHR
ncbi:ferredoxin, partial [Streptomyces sp. NPDC001215]